MRILFVSLSLFLFFIGLHNIALAQYQVSSRSELLNALSKAKPGARIEIQQGTYTNWEVVISVSGSKENPVIISGSKDLKTIFTGVAREKPFFTITGDHVIFENFVFEKIDFSKSVIILDNAVESHISGCTFRNNKGLRQYLPMVVVSGNGLSNEVRSCHFENISDAQLVQVRIKKDDYPRETKIHHNLFTDIPELQWGNGGECVQVGQNPHYFGAVRTEAEVFANKFIRCNGDGEVISNKSSGNAYYDNYFEDCKGELVMRGGHDCDVRANIFLGGKGGIRLSGTGHKVSNNKIENTITGIILSYGTGKGNEVTNYTAVENCHIYDNKIINPTRYGIHVGGSKYNVYPKRPAVGEGTFQNIAPKNNRITNNAIVGKPEKAIFIDEAPANEIVGYTPASN